MKVIILGAGGIGATLAEFLVQTGNAITLVDTNLERLNRLQEKFDLRVVQGYGSYPPILKEAGADQADMLVAVTASDEVNMVACQVAYALFKIPCRLARVRSSDYLEVSRALFVPHVFSVDHLITPEQWVIEHMSRLVEYPGALQMVTFAQGKVAMVAAKAYYGGHLVGNTLSVLKVHLPHVRARVIAIFRRDQLIRPLDVTVVEANDELFFMAPLDHIRPMINALQRLEQPNKHFMIVGGGNVGAGLARKLSKTGHVKLIEREQERAVQLTEQLPACMIFCADIADQALLLEERIEQMDLFITVTDDDAANMVSAILAKRLGVKKSMVLLQQQAYVGLVDEQIIDITISQQQATLSSLMTYMYQGNINHAVPLRRGSLLLIEMALSRARAQAKVFGKPISRLKLPPGVAVVALVRQNELLFPQSETVMQEADHIILLLLNHQQIAEVTRSFVAD